MIAMPVSTMNSKDFACFVFGNVSVKLNSDYHSTEIMDILFRYMKLQWPCVYLAVYHISDISYACLM